MDGSVWIPATAKRHSRLLARMMGRLKVWRRRAGERHRLAQLDDRQLVDIGINRLDRARECRKPFWQP